MDKMISADSKIGLIIEIQKICRQWGITHDDLFYRMDERAGNVWREFKEEK